MHGLRGNLTFRTLVLGSPIPKQPVCAHAHTHTHTSKGNRNWFGRTHVPLQRSEVNREQELSSQALGSFRMRTLSGVRMTILQAWLCVASNTLLFLAKSHAFTGDRPQARLCFLTWQTGGSGRNEDEANQNITNSKTRWVTGYSSQYSLNFSLHLKSLKVIVKKKNASLHCHSVTQSQFKSINSSALSLL